MACKKLIKKGRLKHHPKCKHEFRFLRNYKGFQIFYCIKCLIYSLKDPDSLMDFKTYIKGKKWKLN